MLACWPAAGAAQELTPELRRAPSVEAARAGWQSDAPPAEGWTPVTLPENWAARWPGHDGVVWYRLRWNEPADAARLQAVGLAIESINMAGAVYLNGSLIERDASLAEPLSRSWNLPRHWTLDAPLLRPGENELLVRVSGLAAYAPGLGAVTLGTPEAVREHLRPSEFARRTMQLIGIGLNLAVGVLFGVFWLMRRKETPYGWFGLYTLLWVLYSYNHVALSPWPFGATEPFQRLNHLAMFASVGCFLMFALSYCATARKAAHRAALWFIGGGLAVLLLAPSSAQAPLRGFTVLTALATYLSGVALMARHALRTRGAEPAALTLCLLVPVATGVYDTLVFLEVLPSGIYLTAMASSSTLLGISFALAWRLVKGMRLVENFNIELQLRVTQARHELAEALRHQHEAELGETRLNTRLSLMRDLHDGIGMTLNSHIHQLGGRDDAHDSAALRALREVSSDLRLIIENSSFDDIGDLAQRLAPLRHRCTRLMEAADIDCHWTLSGLQGCKLDGKRGLNFLRVIQEGLANALKHSQATQVSVRIVAEDGHLTLTIRDNGRGFETGLPAASAAGMGLRNMQERAAQLGGALEIHSGAAGTVLGLRFPVGEGVAA